MKTNRICLNCQYIIKDSYEYEDYSCECGIDLDKTRDKGEGFGCDYHYKTLQKMYNDNINSRGEMYFMMSIYFFMTESEFKEEQYIDYMKHTVGLDYKAPYKRHEKLWYKPYRNYWNGFNPLFENLIRWKLAKKIDDNNYKLTQLGIDYLSAKLNINIYKGSVVDE